MNRQDWNRFAAEFYSRLNGQGVFLTAKAGEVVNTMTISWGSVGVFWGKPAITAPVRLSRYTRELIEKSGVFTISIPREGELARELAFCGSKSGRDMDKFAACGITAKPGRTLPAPVVGEAWMHIECRVLFRSDMNGLNFEPDTGHQLYPDKNYHTLYIGEVVDFYEL
jgi:flavin reductase (DIM6/NTAB) family NADH-FMN oxidoreductase RutF